MTSTTYQPALALTEPLTALLRAWERDRLLAGDSERTISSRRYTIRRLARVVDLHTATAEEITDWLSGLRNRRTGRLISLSSRATYQAQVRAFYRWLQRTGRREDDPTQKVERTKVPDGLPHPLSMDEVDALLEACSDPRAATTRAYVILAVYAGLRVHEIAQVRGEDIRLDRESGGRMFVRGKGGREAILPMHPAVVELARSMPSRGWWFPTRSRLGHVHRCSVSSAINRALVRAGVPGVPHALRHTFGTETLRSSRGNLRTTQRAMRHASPTTTARYTLILDDEVEHAISGIPWAAPAHEGAAA